MPKLLGLKEFTKRHGGVFDRIEAVDKTETGDFKLLDLKDATIRAAISEATSAKSLFEGAHAISYPTHSVKRKA